MNKKIKILPNNVANKIAAGEVVQRPASVVKELMENSLDASAKNIEVFIKRAGKVLIQVSDDGEGMSEEDALLSVRRHATSKISSIEDLSNIHSYGFRGEALSSIASVSVFELRTERYDDEIGTLIRIDEEGQLKTEKGSFPKGTSVAVKNLFFNTPARRHFMKSNATELKHIVDVFKKEALAHPEISFKLFNDDDLLFDFKGGTIEERMSSVFADNINDGLLKANEKTDFINLSGFVAKPSYLSRAKGEQYLFINKRFVISRTINHAVFTAYENILEKGDYPFFVLFLEIDPAKVDVNVHPSKLEVKFDDESSIYSFVNAVVKKTIGSYDLVPSMTFDDDTPDRERLRFNKFNKIEKEDFSDRPSFLNKKKETETPAFSDEEIDELFGSINQEIKSIRPASDGSHPFERSQPTEIYHSASEEEDSHIGSASSFIVSLHNKYILAQIKTGLMIIDQHVAHERILYEKALKSLKADMPFSQQLLFPQKVKLDPADYELLQELMPHLNRLGFEIKFKNNFGIEITGVPSEVKVGTEVQTLNEILDEYRKNEREKDLDVLHNIAASYSCKTAIKAGDKLNESEMRILVDQLFATSMPYVCPHGRPIVIKIPLKEFDRRFGRTS
jgi:DNA mismatch repair protein MutL